MCWKKIVDWWNNLQENNPEPPPPNPEPGLQKKIALLFAINNYPGSQNDLQGCLNDQNRVTYNLPDFDKRQLKDSDVTLKKFSDTVLKAAAETTKDDTVVIHYSGHGTYLPDYSGMELDGKNEALYLYDGPLVDDAFGVLLDNFKPGVKVIIFLDSCFSESATRKLNMEPNSDKGKFRIYEGFRTEEKLKHNKLMRNNINWVVLSGCSEHETSADAYIGGQFNGAFTYYLWQCIDRKLTYRQWYAELRKSLPSTEYDQTPTLDGPDDILDSLIFT